MLKIMPVPKGTISVFCLPRSFSRTHACLMACAKTIKVRPIISQDRDRQHDKTKIFLYVLVSTETRYTFVNLYGPIWDFIEHIGMNKICCYRIMVWSCEIIDNLSIFFFFYRTFWYYGVHGILCQSWYWCLIPFLTESFFALSQFFNRICFISTTTLFSATSSGINSNIKLLANILTSIGEYEIPTTKLFSYK